MSCSIDGPIRRPIEVSALLQHTREVLRELLATDEVPELSSNTRSRRRPPTSVVAPSSTRTAASCGR
ncbi:hypothetical protein [Lentzea atacamensis]|uniref:hypothetical protein n=1 Tax=Lentzea atacamensis TaxID=531938 RepID=UPI0011BF94D8|nr:hypothetical protein [Lentzea atacamensis]